MAIQMEQVSAMENAYGCVRMLLLNKQQTKDNVLVQVVVMMMIGMLHAHGRETRGSVASKPALKYCAECLSCID